MHAVARGDSRLKVLALALAAANLVLWYAAPWLRDSFDAVTGRLASPLRPMVLNGVQELLVYYDPWLARGVFPLVYTLGFVAIAFLFQPAPDAAGAISGSAAVAILLLSFEAVWVFLMAFTILFRGPDWNFYWPWEAWVPKLVPKNPVNFSDVFWKYLAGLKVPHTPWIVHEAPSLLLTAGYLSLGLLVARPLSQRVGYSTAYCCFVLLTLFALVPLFLLKMTAPEVNDFGVKMLIFLLATALILVVSYPLFRLLRPQGRSWLADRPIAYWRCVLLVFLVQVAALVPVKMLLYWIFNLKYFIHAPADSVNL